MLRRLPITMMLPFLLSGCIFGLGGDEPAAPPGRHAPAGYPTTLVGPTPRETEQCYADLSKIGIRYNPLPDRDYGGGCQVLGAVQLLDVGVPITGIKAMRCPLARAFIAWLRNAVAPAAYQSFGSELVRVETYGTYSCRNVVGRSQSARRLSGHGIANAVDVAGFVLRDGRRITVEAGWRSPDGRERDFLRVIHQSACRRFGTVLSPDYNAAHYNHIHLEADAARYCR